ncbi:MAG: hypothetical protein EOO13_04140 [Chitinophagaceae bacterium]|nr:MAG: hypothetical protein EOO13_04140 [Chitinophagaceae bacterium]
MFLIIHFGCSDHANNPAAVVSPAFYHWKTEFAPTAFEWDVISQNKVKDIYLRFFDVSWDNSYNRPLPVAQLRMADKNIIAQKNITVIPTVFITNECIKNIGLDQCSSLAKKIYQLVNDVARVNAVDSFSEIQVDCDWTATTKEKYFSLLTALQQIDSSHVYSATIRLYQVKYVTNAGVPPVKKGLLMCYNMGNLKDASISNSILDPATLEKYTTNLNSYPLPLDVALPLFDWYVLFRKNEYKGLLQQVNEAGLKMLAKPIGKNRWEILMDTTWRNISFQRGDVLRHEMSDFKDILQSAGIIRKKLSNRQLRLSLYHLDSITLSKYSAHEMEAIFRSLR